MIERKACGDWRAVIGASRLWYGAGLIAAFITNLRAIFVALCAGAISTPALAESRLALVITNQSYSDDIGRLANSHRDGVLIVEALRRVGFEAGNIAVVKDADQPAMRLALADFVERLEKAGPDTVAFLYFSGHGAADRTERGENYLIPVGARITVAKQLPILGVGLSEIAKTLERVPAKARFIVVDACRNVAFTKGLKDAAKGFVPERKLDGMIVAFATRPGETADDNNIYAMTLAGILPTPGLESEQVFKETQRRVAELSKGNQVPWTEDGLLTRFRFKEGEAVPEPPSVVAPQMAVIAAPTPPAAPPQPTTLVRPAPPAQAPPPKTASLKPPIPQPTPQAPASPQACTLDARQTDVDEAGRVYIALQSSCPMETINIRYRDWTFTRRLPSSTMQQKFIFDLFQGPAQLSIDTGSAVATLTPSVPASQSLVKIALVWDAPVELNLHILQFAARPGEADDVWSGNPRGLSEARSGRSGFISYTDPSERVQVYTYIKSRSQSPQGVYVRVDYASRGARAVEPYCGTGSLTSVGYTIVQYESGKSEEHPRSRSINRKPCGATLSDDERYEEPVSRIKF